MFQHQSGTGYVNKNGGNTNTSTNPMQVRRNKSDYCWNFTKEFHANLAISVNLLKGVNIVTPQHMEFMRATNYKKGMEIKTLVLVLVLDHRLLRI